jgi:cytochrome d ubiquinol oxidase subunit II
VLNTIWFVLIALLWIGYFFLEGFDFGVGMLLPFVGRGDRDRGVLIGTVGPLWDGNEVWLIVAAGATFAAFPIWYATMFSGFYAVLLLILVALIVRAAAFEFRGRRPDPRWRRWWERALFFGSAVPALLWGIAFADILRGVPIGPTGDYVGGVLDLLQPYALVGGAAFLLLFALHGALFLALKLRDGDLVQRALRAGRWVWPFAAAAVAAFLAWSYADGLGGRGQSVVPSVAPVAAVVAVIAAGWLLAERRPGWAFAATGAAIVLVTVTVFSSLYPRVMSSSLSPRYDLTIYNSSSSAYTLGVMTIAAVVFLPVVLAYQAWTYWVFRRRIGRDELAEGY